MRKYILALSLAVVWINSTAQISWEKEGGPYGGSVSDIEIAPDGNLFILTENTDRIYKSSDDGITWQLIDISALQVNESVNDIEIATDGTLYAVTSFANFYSSGNDGANWTKLNTGTNSSNGGFDSGSKIEINPVTGDLLMMGYEGVNHVMYISTNGGVTWLIGGVITNSVDDFVVSNAGSSGMIFVFGCCGTASVYASDDGGFNFTEQLTGLGGEISINDMAIGPNGSDVFLLTPSNVFKWDGEMMPNLDWVSITENLPFTSVFSGVLCTATSGTADYLFYGDNDNNILYKKDLSGINNWTTQNSNFAENGSEALKLVAKDENKIFVAANSVGFFRSTNAGSTWIDSNAGIENQRFNALITSSNGSRIIVAADQDLYTSSNEGATWTRVDLSGSGNFNNSISKFIRLDNGNIYGYGTANKVSADDGVSWNDVPSPFTSNSVETIVNSDQLRFFALDYADEIAFSNDAGATWTTPIPITISLTNYDIQKIFADENHNLYALIYDNDVFQKKLYKISFNPDPGTAVPTSGAASLIDNSITGFTISNNNLENIFFRNGKLYALGRDTSGNWKLCISSDGGTSFTSKDINDGGYNMFVAPNGYILLARSDNNDNQTIFLSRDDGDTFISVSVGNNSLGFVRAADLNESTGVAYILMEYRGLYKTTGTIVLPEPPVNFTMAGRSATGLTLRFEGNSLNETGFVIQRKIGNVFVNIDTTGSNFEIGQRRYYRQRNLQPETTYDYRVCAFNDAGNSAFVPLSVTTLPQTTPSIPDNRSWTGVTANIDGLAPPGTNLTIAIRDLGNGRYSISDVTAGVLASTPFSEDTEIPAFFYESNGETYFEPSEGPLFEEQNGTWNGSSEITLFWRLDKNSGTGYPDKYEKITLTLNANDPTPQAPANASAYIYSDDAIEVNWQPVAYEKSFTIERKTGATGAYAEVGTVQYPETSFIDPGPFTLNTTYFYQVKSQNGNTVPGESAYSNEAQVTFVKPNLVLAQTTVNSTPFNSLGMLWSDFNNDGFDDLMMSKFELFSFTQSVPLVFQNDGAGNFSEIATNLDAASYANGTAADYDNDGDIDLFYSTFGELNRLYNGNGTFTFSKVDPTILAEALVGDIEGASFSNSWIDYNNDGLLDLFVARNDNLNSSLYQQNEDHTFTKITTAGDLVNTVMGAFATAWSDYDNDGDQDVFVVDQIDDQPNKLFRNNSDGTFTKITGSVFDGDVGLNPQDASWADFDNDGDFDLFVGNEDAANSLFRNNGNGTFTKLTASPYDVTTSSVLGSNWIDINNDGFIDLLITGQSGNALFLNVNGTSFTRVTGEKILDNHLNCISSSSSDFDNDGFMDIVLSRTLLQGEGEAGTPQNTLLFRNNNSSGNWIKIRLVGTQSNRSAIGTRIKVTTGTKSQIREVNPHIGVGSQNSLIQHFGLGNASVIDNIQITWPSGTIQNLSNTSVNQTITITEDGTGPEAIVLNPANNATGVASNTTVSITLDEDSSPVAGKLLLLYLHSDLSTPILGIDVTDAEKSGNTYTFTISPKLLTNTQYNVSVDAGAFTDAFGNASLEFPTGLWTFTTDAGPAITTLAPAHNSTNVAANASLSITFDEAVEATSGKTIQLFRSADLVTPVQTFSAGDGVISGQSVTFTLNTKLERATMYTVTVDEGAFVSAAGANDFAGLSAGDWTFTTDAGPTITTVSPGNGVFGVAVNAPLEITFDKNIFAVTGKKIKVTDGTTTFADADVSASGNITDNVYTLAAPTDGWPYITTLQVSVEAGAFTDATQNDFAGITADNWTFTTEEAPDVSPPSISFDESVLTTLEKTFSPITISVGIMDDHEIASALMYHRKVGERDFIPATLTFNTTNGMYETQITNAFADDMGFEYYFEALDNAATPNKGRLPEGDIYYKSTIAFTNSPPALTLPSGGTSTSWKVISIPYVVPTNQIETILSSLGTYDKTKWRMIVYAENPDPSWIEYPSFTTISRGKGYFINTKDGASITLNDASSPAETRDNLFSMSLEKGWNLVGNPYTVAINWEDVRSYNPAKNIGALKTFNSGSYTNGNELLPFQGGFVYMDAAAADVKIPFKGQSTPGGGRIGFADLGTDIDAETWDLKFDIHQGAFQYTLGSIGMAIGASPGFDGYDDITPPRFFDYLELNFAHPEYYARRFTRDVVPTQESYTWEFTVNSNLTGLAELTWDNTALTGAARDLFLLDVSRQKLVNMKETGRYLFNPKESSNFRLYFGENLDIAPKHVQLGNAYPNPTNGYTAIAFSLPETGGLNQQVSLDIMDVTGRTVGTISQGRMNPGYHEAGFNAKELNNGFYTYRLTVQNKNGRSMEVNKLIIE